MADCGRGLASSHVDLKLDCVGRLTKRLWVPGFSRDFRTPLTDRVMSLLAMRSAIRGAARKLFAPQWRVDSVRRRVMSVRSGLEEKPVGPMFAVLAEIIGSPYDADGAIACPTTERFRSPEAIG